MDVQAEDSQPATKGDVARAFEALTLGHGQRMDGFGGQIDQLGRRMDTFGQRIDGFDQRLDAFGERMDKFDQRMDKFDQRMDAFGERMDKFDQRMDAFGERMDKFDQRMDKFDQRLDLLDKKIDRVAIVVVRNEARMERIEANMVTKDEVKSYMKVLHDIASRTEALMRIATIHGQALTEGQTTLKDHERRLGALES